MSYFRQIPVPTGLLLLGFTVLFNFTLGRAAIDLTQSDYSINALISQQFLEGSFSIFPPAQDYGGTAWTGVRALWLLLWSLLPGHSHLDWQPQLAFDYFFSPFIFGLIAYSIARSLEAGKRTALVCGALGTLGLPGLIPLFGNDFYIGALTFGTGSILLRSRSTNPLFELPLRRVIWLGILNGLALYCWRGAIPLILASILPTTRSAGAQFLKPDFNRISRWGLGLLIALTPELMHRLSQGNLPFTQSNLDLAFTSGFLRNLSALPGAFFEFISGQARWRPLGLLSYTAFCVSLFALSALIFRSKNDTNLRPWAFAVVLSLLGYCMTITYASGASRYLAPLVPCLFASLSLGISFVLEQKNKRSWIYFLGLVGLFSCHIATQLQVRHKINDLHRLSSKESTHQTIIARFRQAHVQLVQSDDYWNTNTFSLLASHKPTFVGPGRPHYPKRALELARNETRIGVLSSKPDFVPDTTRIIEPLGTVGPFYLSVGERLPNRFPGR